MKTIPSITFHALVAALTLFTTPGALAETWTGGGTNNNWSTGANWGGSAPANPSANAMIFTNNGIGSGSSVDTDWQVNQLVFHNTNGTWNLTGSALTLTNSVPTYVSGAGAVTIGNDVNLTSPGVVRFAGTAGNGSTITFNGKVTAGAGVTGLGSYNFTNQNAVVNGQIVETTAGLALTLNGNWTLANASNNFSGNITIGAGGNVASTLTVKSLSDIGVASAIGRGSQIVFYGLGSSGNITQTLIVDSASGGSTDRTINLASASATVPLIGRIVSNVAGQMVTFSGNFTNSSGAAQFADLQLDGAGNGTISGTINNTIDNVLKTGAGTWTLSGSNAYTGNTTVSGGRLVVGHANALGSTAQGTTVSGNNVDLQVQGGITVVGETVTLNSTNGPVYLSGAGSNTATWDGNVVLAGTNVAGFRTSPDSVNVNIAVGSDSADTITGSAGTFLLRGALGTGTINSAINIGATLLAKTDSGTWVIASTNNNFTGAVQVSTGVLSFGAIANGGTNSSIGAGTEIRLGQNAGGGSGTGTLRFTGASGGSSDRTILINNGALGGAGVIENTVEGQTLTLSGNIAPNVTNGSTLTVTGAGNTALNGNIAGTALAFTKSGLGTVTLSGNNSYTGNTTVSAGSLIINGNQSAATGVLTVASGATLGGSGIIGGATTINGNLQPGNSPGILTFSNGLTLTGTAVTTMEIIAGAGPFTRGTDFDGIDVGGLLTYDGSLVFSLTGVQFGVGNYSFDLFNSLTVGGGFDSVNLNGLYAGALTNSGGIWAASIGNGSITNNWTFTESNGLLALEVVPEPSTYALLILSGAGLAAHVIRRRRLF